jgi:hypothetical protein
MDQLLQILTSLLGETVGFYDQEENYYEGELIVEEPWTKWSVDGMCFKMEDIKTIGWSSDEKMSIIWL